MFTCTSLPITTTVELLPPRVDNDDRFVSSFRVKLHYCDNRSNQVTQNSKEHPGAMEAYPGAVETHPGAAEAHTHAVEAHPGATETHYKAK